MKKTMLYTTIFAAALISFSCYKPENTRIMEQNTNTAKADFYSLNVKAIDGTTINFADLKGKKVLIVNTASECGYTPQYEELEQLHKQYKDQLVVIGFPCNQFGGQEPGTETEIVTFCEKNYGVTFPLTEKVDVKGSNQHPVYQWLTRKDKNGKDNFEVKWNFNKFLVDEHGELIAYFESAVKPMSEKVTAFLKK